MTKWPPGSVLLEKILLKTSRNSQEHTCVEVSFLTKLYAFLFGFLLPNLFIRLIESLELNNAALFEIFSCHTLKLLILGHLLFSRE